MKRLFSLLFLFFILGIVNLSKAQVTATATTGITGPVVYTTVKAAFDAVNAGIHTGSIFLSISANTTETDKAILNGNGMGSAAYSSLTLKPSAGNFPTITGNILSGIIALNGASNVIIDGSNTVGGTSTDLTIVNEGSNGNVISFLLSASQNVVKNCQIRSSAQNTGTIIFLTGNGTAGNNYNTIENNDITNSASGFPHSAVVNKASTGIPNKLNRIINNRIYNFRIFGYTDGAFGGGYSDSTLIEGNEFYTTVTQSTPFTAIYVEGAGGIRNMKISKNKIYNLFTSGSQVVGIMLFEAVSVTVENNMISLSNSPSTLIGISQETDNGAVITVYHNTVHISGTTDDYNSFALFKNWLSKNDVFRNNILINTRQNNTGTKGQYAFVKLNTGTFTSNYNNLYSVGNMNNHIAFTNVSSNPVYYPTLSTWQTLGLQDANSISVRPVFVSPTDLHLMPDSNWAIDNHGTFISTILNDIDGQTRSTTTPDMGADEFDHSIGCMSPLVTGQPVALAVCQGQPANFSFTAIGTGPLTYQWKKNGNNISGATNATYSIASTVAGDAGNYQVAIAGSCGTVNSNTVGLSVNACTSIPIFVEGIKGMTLMPNFVASNATLRVQALRSMQMSWIIVDMNGKTVHSFERQLTPGVNDIELVLSVLPAGYYHLQGQTKNGNTGSLKFLKL